MDILSLAIAAGLSFCFLAALFRPLEVAFPARPAQRFFRPDWFTDLCFFFGQYLLWSGLVLWGITGVAGVIDGIVPAGIRAAVASQPFWLQSIEVILLSDVLIYWGHRLQHRVEFLWRFHSVHHSAEHLDWLAAHREHPLDSIYTVGLINLPALLLGFSLEALVGFVAFRGLWAIYIHSNVRLPIGPLRYLIGSSQIHHWHHDRDRDAGNYANLSPLMDIVFGTWYCPDHEPESFGLREPSRGNYLTHLLRPLLPKRLEGFVRLLLFCSIGLLVPHRAEAQYSWNRPPFRVDVGAFHPSDTIRTIPVNEIRSGVTDARVVLLDSTGGVIASATYVEGDLMRSGGLYRFDSLPHEKVMLRITHSDYMTVTVPIDGGHSLPGGSLHVLHPAVEPIATGDVGGPPILMVNLGQKNDLWTGSYHYGYRSWPRTTHLLVLDYPSEIPIAQRGGGAISLHDTLRTLLASFGDVEVVWDDCGKMVIADAGPPDSGEGSLWERSIALGEYVAGLDHVTVAFFGGMWRVEDMISHRIKTSVMMLGPRIQLRPASRVTRIDSLLARSVLPHELPEQGTIYHGILIRELPDALGPRLFEVIDELLRSGLISSFGYDAGRICVYAD